MFHLAVPHHSLVYLKQGIEESSMSVRYSSKGCIAAHTKGSLHIYAASIKRNKYEKATMELTGTLYKRKTVTVN